MSRFLWFTVYIWTHWKRDDVHSMVI